MVLGSSRGREHMRAQAEAAVYDGRAEATQEACMYAGWN